MSKKRTILQETYPYHITARSINKEYFMIDKAVLWSIFCDYLFLVKYGFDVRIHSFVLMDNHFHLILSTPLANLSQCMNYFMREVSREVSRNNQRINQTFGGPYHWCILDSYSYYLNAYKYVYRNPVDANIVGDCENYMFSTLYGILGHERLSIPIEEDTVLFNGDVKHNLQWLNKATPEHVKWIKSSLKKKYFRFEKERSTGKLVLDEDFVF